MTNNALMDSAHMARALEIAERGRFTAKPNPVVGCLIVKGSTVIAEGWHERAGCAHAEVNALQAAGEAAYGLFALAGGAAVLVGGLLATLEVVGLIGLAVGAFWWSREANAGLREMAVVSIVDRDVAAVHRAMDIEIMEYVEAARLRGEGLWWIMWREILPNALTPLAAEFGLRFCFVFLLISGLSFLGLGLQPPLADWGAMVRGNADGIAWGIYHGLIPAGCIALLTISVNLLVDWLVHKASGLREDQ